MTTINDALAIRIGLKESLILTHIYNKANGERISVLEINFAFRYLTKNEIYGAISRLEKDGHLKVEDSKTVDRRKKYTVTPLGIEAIKTTQI